jgi:hypothetical protein
MKRTFFIPMAALVLLAACSETSSNPMEEHNGPLAASSVHLKGGGNAEPTFTDGGLFLSASGALSGLSGADIFVLLSATANATSTCTNNGGTAAAGQNPAPTTVSGGDPIPADEFKNGNVTFSVQTEPPVSPIPGAPGCPNPNWTETIDDLRFTSATITVHQPAGTAATPGPTVLTVQCTFSSSGPAGAGTQDGGIAANQVSCTQS